MLLSFSLFNFCLLEGLADIEMVGGEVVAIAKVIPVKIRYNSYFIRHYIARQKKRKKERRKC
jgi:hypothetical protein